MVYCYNNSISSFGSGQYNMLGQFSHGLEGFNGVMRDGSMVHQALVLDTEKGELVKAPARVGKKEVSEAKVLAALKSHSEAERRRRERINAHLATLRGLVPSTEKMDKATLLAEVINQVKELKKNAIESSQGLVVPMDGDELKVESYNDGAVDGTLCFKASLCCNYRPELLSDIRQIIDTLQLKMVSTEVSTLQNRLKTLFIFTTSRNRTAAVNDAEAAQLLTDSIQQALNSVVEKGSASPEYSPRTTLPNKRRRVTFFDSSSSSS